MIVILQLIVAKSSMSLDLFIVVSFLLLTLVFGLEHGHGVRNIKGYALGGRNFSTATLVITIVSSWASLSGLFLTASKTYVEGLYYVCALTAIAISFIILAYFIIPRMSEFIGKLSIAEAMGEIYGNKVRLITALASITSLIGLLLVQFKAFSNVINHFTGIQSDFIIIISGFIVTIYSAFGGIRAIAFTDILQFFVFGIIIPILVFVIWCQFYNTNYNLNGTIQDIEFNLGFLFDIDNEDPWKYIILFVYLMIPSISPVMFQKISMGRDLTQIKKAFLYSAVILILIQCITILIPFLIYIVNPTINSDSFLPHIINTYDINGLKGLILIAVIALVMSSVDSRMNAVAVLFAHDIYVPYIKKEKYELLVAKLVTMVLGGLVTTLSVMKYSILEIVITTNSFCYPLVMPPFLLYIFGFHSSSKSVLIAISAAFLSVFLWKLLPTNFLPFVQGIIGISIGILVNIVFLFGTHYLLNQPGGWKYNRYDQSIYPKYQWLISSRKYFDIMYYFKRASPSDERAYIVLGVYSVVCTILSMYTTYTKYSTLNLEMMNRIYLSMFVVAITMISYSFWPRSFKVSIKKTIMQVSYPFAIFYILIFLNCFFIFISGFTTLQIVLFSINIIIVSVLLGWRLAIVFFTVGFYSAVKFHQYFIGPTGFIIKFCSPEFILIYLLLAITIILILLLKPKKSEDKQNQILIECMKKEINYTKNELELIQKGFDFLDDYFKKNEGNLRHKELYLKNELKCRNIEIHKLGNMKNEFLRNTINKPNVPIVSVLNMCELLYSYYNELNDVGIKEVVKEIVHSGDRLKKYLNTIINLSKLSSSNDPLNRELVNLEKLVRERTLLYKKIFPDDYEEGKVFDFNIKGSVVVYCDCYYITQVIDHLIINAVNYGNSRIIKIDIKNIENNSIVFLIKSDGNAIPKEELISIFTKFSQGSNSILDNSLGLVLCKAVVEAHNGRIRADSNSSQTIFSFILPKD